MVCALVLLCATIVAVLLMTHSYIQIIWMELQIFMSSVVMNKYIISRLNKMKRYYELDWADGVAHCITPCPVEKMGICIGSLACHSCGAFIYDSFFCGDYMNGDTECFVECNNELVL